MKAKEQRPKCGNCSHLREKAVSDVSSVLWCDIPNGNRKASRDVGGCEHFNRKEEG